MKIRIGSAQDIGKRNEQQDCFDFSFSDGEIERALLVVCDGMGGLPFGKEVAIDSREPVDYFRSYLLTSYSSNPESRTRSVRQFSDIVRTVCWVNPSSDSA
jgi:serine/threonine protein phosphatase PrpC